MTTKYISTYIPSGYALKTTYSQLYVTSTGGVGGLGVSAAASATITNYGKINATHTHYGVNLIEGGYVRNVYGATINGGSGVVGHASATINNLGLISSPGSNAIDLLDGGLVINGNLVNSTARVRGDVTIKGQSGTVVNDGTITGNITLYEGGYIRNGRQDSSAAYLNGVISSYFATVRNYGEIALGVQLLGGGIVSNGSVTDRGAYIKGASGVTASGSATVTNFGAIVGQYGVPGDYGVFLYSGGSLTNGASSDAVALISGYTGVSILSAPTTLANFGTIEGLGVATTQSGVYLKAGGRLVNGGATDTAALIEGAVGVHFAAAGAVINHGTIEGQTGDGVLLSAGGTVTNGGGGERSALIEGGAAAIEAGAYAAITNSGTLIGVGTAVILAHGGYLKNGSANNHTALVEGYSALYLGASARAVNFGAISGLSDGPGQGVFLTGGASVVNRLGGVIEGYQGVVVSGPGTVTNFGAIDGAGGAAVYFQSSSDLLNVEAGSSFQGLVFGDGGTLDLASGVGTISSFAGSLTVSGSMASTTFDSFNTVEIGAGATFTDAGAVTIIPGQTLLAAGTVTIGATSNSGVLQAAGGTLAVTGAVTGTGTAVISGGTLDFLSSFKQNVTFTGTTGVLELAQSQTYTGAITGFSKSGGTSLDLADIGFVSSTEATFSSGRGVGTLTVTDGTHTAHITLKGNYAGSTFIASSDGHGGTIVIDPRTEAPLVGAAPSAASHPFVAAMASLGGASGTHIQLAESRGRPDFFLAKPHVMAA